MSEPTGMLPSPNTRSHSKDYRGGHVAWIDRVNEGVGSFIRWLVLAMVVVGAYNALAAGNDPPVVPRLHRRPR